MSKIIWIAREANDNTDTMRCFFDKASAMNQAHVYLNHLTEKERAQNTVSVESWPVNVPDDDPRDAETLLDDLYDEGDYPFDGAPATWEEIK